MIFKIRPLRLASQCLATGLLVFGLLGCASDRGARDGGPPQPVTPLAGQESFFDQQIVAQISVGHGPRGPQGKGGSDRPRGGGGGMRRGGPGGPPPGGGDGPAGGLNGPRLMAANGPLRMIHLTLSNTGTETITLVIRDFLSPLGNFAVQPEKLTLTPGTTVETEPMASRLQGDYAEIDVTLALHAGQKTERKVVKLTATPAAGP